MNCVKKNYHGYECWDFEFEGRQAKLVFPQKPLQDKKWLIKTEYFEAFPSLELEMLSRGYFLAYLSNSTRWFAADDSNSKARFAEFLSENFGLNKKCLPVGLSCGGMHAVYFAADYPELVAALYLDAPVLNLLSCPCAVGLAKDKSMYDEFVSHTGLTVSELINYRNHPIDRVNELIDHKIPVILVCGDSDTVVPYEENGKHLAIAYRASGATFEEIIKHGCGHHPHGLDDNTPIIRFVQTYY